MENNRLVVLKRRSDFQKIKDKGCKVRPVRWLLLAFYGNNERFRVGWTVPRKVGSAVTRNRLKRWCREFFRKMQHAGPAIDLNVVFLGPSKNEEFFKKLKHTEFEAEILSAWQEISCSTKSSVKA